MSTNLLNSFHILGVYYTRTVKNNLEYAACIPRIQWMEKTRQWRKTW